MIPKWIWAPATAAITLVALPLLGMILRVPWGSLAEILGSRAALQALGLSLVTSLCATALALVLGVPVAFVLARSSGVMGAILRSAVLVPMVLPPVVAGLALLATFGRRGLVGAALSEVGIEIGFTTFAVILAQTFVSMPFFIISLEGALRSSTGRYAAIAATLGAGPTRVLGRVILPMARPALAAGMALTFARALGEFGATLTFAGSLPGTTRTMPLLIYLAREQDQDLALALALVLIVVALVIVVLSARLQRRNAGWAL